MATITVGGHALTLLPEKAAFLDDFRTLLVADAHIGKAVSFRSFGIPVPRGTTSANLGVLTRLIERTNAARVVFLGDFLHSKRSHAPATMDAVARWRDDHAGLELTLIRGNHDDRAGDPPASIRFSVVDEPLTLGGLALCHHPQDVPGLYALAGHIHPCIRLGGRAFDSLRLPCFHVTPGHAVLPAFGSFTGMHPIRPGEGDRIFAIADDAIQEV